MRVLPVVWLLVAATPAAADGLALIPPMGWNSWNKFRCDVSEKLIKESADALVATGMKDAGYRYLVIDDCWQVRRDAQGRIVPDPDRFPSGMKALADYVHDKGLKFGLYSDAGTGTCAKRPGSKDHERVDARTYAEWGVDYLKYDWCNTDGQDTRASVAHHGGHPGLLGLRQELGRHGRRAHHRPPDRPASPRGPRPLDDPDMLEVGNGGLTIAESRAHFSFWALLAAPLMAGNDLRAMSAEMREILTNREVIAVDQDPLGMQGRKVRDNGPQEVWMKPLADGSRAVILFNRGTEAGDIAVSWEEIGLAPAGKALVRDLWKKADAGSFRGHFEAKAGPHDVVMVRITPEP